MKGTKEAGLMALGGAVGAELITIKNGVAENFGEMFMNISIGAVVPALMWLFLANSLLKKK